VTRKILLGFAVVAVIVVGIYFRFYRARQSQEIAYSGNRSVTVWSTSAQVREPIATINFGERLEVLQRFQDQVKIRTPQGVVGWVAEHDILSADLWQTLKDLDKKAEAMPAAAKGHTRVLSNLHFGPGRDTTRIRQLFKDVPLDLLLRQPELINPATRDSLGQDSPSSAAEGKKEDWWFVRAHTTDQGVLAGWLLSRFVELDVPQGVADYASSAGMRIIAWSELNRVENAGGEQIPQYLLVGVQGPEGQACDFTTMRVYTWGKQKQHYETAFVESGLCGRLPIQLTAVAGQRGDVKFSFQDIGHTQAEERSYQMHQTIVRRLNYAAPASKRKHQR
jgi:hypothetical protein